MSVFSLSPNWSTKLAIGAVGSQIHAALVAGGWAQTSDTGQVSWASFDGVPAANVVLAFEVWRMNDALASTAPVFIKLEYGITTSYTTPLVWLTIGTGSDGAGNITGVIFPATPLSRTSDGGYVIVPSYVCGGPSWLACSLWPSHGGYAMCFVIERTKDAVGADTDQGVMFATCSVGNVSAYICAQRAYFTGVPTTLFTKWNVLTPPGISGAWSPDINVYPVRCWDPGETLPFTGIVACIATDFAAGSTVNITCWDGVVRGYVAGEHVTVGFGNTNRPMWRIS